jgi:DNA repair photolyase
MQKTKHLKGRGSVSNEVSRFVEHTREDFDDGWDVEEEAIAPRTQLFTDNSRKIVTYNESPDISFDRSINPYKGCEHGCVYCFARPTHAYLDLSPGLDFETKIFIKPNAAKLLEKELAAPRYRAQPIALGVNTDAYQPIERKLGITREILQVLSAHSHPVEIVTKSSLVERDLDILAPMAERNLARVIVSVTTLDHSLSRVMEPRATAPKRRLKTIRNLHEAGVSVGLLFAPVIPVLNDSEMESIVAQATRAGVNSAGYVVLRLPHELKTLFQEWLHTHYPLKAEHVMNRVRDMRGGKAYQAGFGQRMTGTGEFATLISQRFRLACKKAGIPQGRENFEKLDCSLFEKPARAGDQLCLF